MSSKNEFLEFENDLLNLAEDFNNGKDMRKFMKKDARSLNKIQRKTAKKLTNKKTGNLIKAKNFKAGKVYKSHNGSPTIRAYTNSPHAHLIDIGHEVISHGNKKGFREGNHFMEKAQKSFENEHFENTQNFIDDLIKKGL